MCVSLCVEGRVDWKRKKEGRNSSDDVLSGDSVADAVCGGQRMK